MQAVPRVGAVMALVGTLPSGGDDGVRYSAPATCRNGAQLDAIVGASRPGRRCPASVTAVLEQRRNGLTPQPVREGGRLRS